MILLITHIGPVDGDPIDYTNWIDPDMQTGSTNLENFTHYFDKMSLGVYDVIGKAISVEAPKTKQQYGSNYGLANKEVLQQVVDDSINFNLFDNWTCNGDYDQDPGSDGTVDFILMIWRASNQSYFFNQSWSGIAGLGGSSFTVEGGKKTIKTFLGCGLGSGVTVIYWGERTPKYTFHSSVHEIGHFLIGGVHPYNSSGTDRHSIWGILTTSGAGICANVFERERLAWINPNVITGDILNAPFFDYVTTGTSYKYHPSNGATNEWYYFSNHQKLHIYDDATINENDKGIFVMHASGPYNSSNNIRVKTANGNWDWQNPTTVTCFGGANVGSYKPISVDRAGRNNRDYMLKSGGGGEWLYHLSESGIAGWPMGCGGYLHGYNLNNSFNLTYNDVFSPKSNPYTHTWTGNQNNFTMEVFGQNGSVLNVRFYLTSPYNGKPSKPQNLRVTASANLHPYLTWDANTEPDLAGYTVYKFNSSSQSWQFLATRHSNMNYYEDVTEDYCPSGQSCISGHYVHYRVTSKDNQSKESIPSDSIRTFVLGGNPQKITVKPQVDIIPNEYKLGQNYPNPFNPLTTIEYQLPKSGLVQLKVYDLLGREVSVLVNEVQTEGAYTINFDAGNLPSGIYICSLRVNDFVQNNKMTLLK
jgi:hypothetical protein